MTDRAKLMAAASAAMFVFGIVLAILGVLFGLPETRLRLGVDLTQQGVLFFALMLGVFVSTMFVGPLIDTFGHKAVLIVSTVIVAAAFPLFAAAHSFLPALAIVFLTGFGGGGLNTAANALVADVYPERRGAALNVVGVFVGVGAVIVPLLTAFPVTQLLLIAGGCAAACGCLCAIVKFPAQREPVRFSFLASVRVARTPGVMLFAMLLFCQSGNEQSVSGWTSTYLWSTGASPRIATAVVGGYWAALMIGRIIATPLLKRISPAQLVLASAIGSATGCAILFLARSIGMLATGAIICGLSFAAIYPTVLAMTADRYQRMAGTIFGLLFAVGLIGGMSFPLAIGRIAQQFGVRAGMVLPFAGALVITRLAMQLLRRTTSRG
jgi:FHS family glucose/mannose:H+ symporter-like MFS transporter